MLRNPLFVYFAGMATFAIPYCLASGAPQRAGFILGGVGALAVLIACLASRNRALRAGNFLIRIAGGRSPKVKTPVTPIREKSAQVKGGVFPDVVLGLRGMGCDSKTARFAAGQATMRLPDAGFAETFKLAVQVATGRAA